MTILDDARAGMDLSIRPQDDLFGHVNGHWLETEEIPPDRSAWGAGSKLAVQAEEDVRALVEECASASDGVSTGSTAEHGSPTQQIGDLWRSFMDEERIEELGADPVQPDLAALQAIGSLADLVTFVGGLERRGMSGFFRAYINTDDRNSDRYVVNLLQGGIGLPDESYYREEKFAEIREAYVAYLTRIFELTGNPEPA